jgi:GNAT superfamily N-acetyltransferase
LEEYFIRAGRENMDVHAIHKYLSGESYWAKGISLELVEKSLDHSFCVGVFAGHEQVGFARLITDYATFGWLADVYVLKEHRGRGLSKKMLTHIMNEPWSKQLRRKMLNTRDGHGLYRQFGFRELAYPTRIMEDSKPNIYLGIQD